MQKGASWPRVNTTATRVSFEEETSIAAPERANPLSSISSVPPCCWQGKSLPGHVRRADGSSKKRMEGCPPHTHLRHRGVHCSWVGTWCYTPHSLGTPLPKQPETAMSSGSYSIGLCLCSSSWKTFMAPHSSSLLAANKAGGTRGSGLWGWALSSPWSLGVCTGYNPRPLLGPGATHLHSSLPSILMTADLHATTLPSPLQL